MSQARLDQDEVDQRAPSRQLALAVTLFVLTCVSTTYVGSLWSGGNAWSAGLSYSVPLMAILLAHELGHYIAARIHRVPASPPYFIPMPLPPLGTMGAVMLMRDRIAARNALLDIGAAGPLAGLAVALPILAYGIMRSPVQPEPQGVVYFVEGRSLLYLGLLYALKGPIPAGYDIMLGPTAFAGWAGLLVTMLNLIPCVQLDGGHVAYALFGDSYERVSRVLRHLLFPFGIAVALAYGLPALRAGKHGEALWSEITPGLSWLTWWFLLSLLARRGGREHPPVDPGLLSPHRRVLAWFTLTLFALLFMPTWLRTVTP
jgi:membrane-associated protease RseP (regulator of RpoE activity)